MAVSDAAPPSNTIAGWREWVSLPGLGVPWVKAKLDTGARSSAIHAFDIHEFDRDGEAWVRYSIHPWQRSGVDAVDCESRVVAQRHVRSSSGHTQERYVVNLDVSLVGRVVSAEVTLSRRDEMGFRMLVGREALRGSFLVDSGRSYLGGRPERAVRRQNRGR
ncbi:ATP-dependent zinc protease family protein [Nocardioides coralli]|uniref:ATP-dependent zinc protease family protein n=1 Tax=Nocardioides coralli TaxID=2872154 RepID=UPI001CA3CB4C|nr:RimK/LysX family protein [Nocardioides coralli]QZY29072.1 RimK/LysX family protein [Nocardioides coralli]